MTALHRELPFLYEKQQVVRDWKCYRRKNSTIPTPSTFSLRCLSRLSQKLFFWNTELQVSMRKMVMSAGVMFSSAENWDFEQTGLWVFPADSLCNRFWLSRGSRLFSREVDVMANKSLWHFKRLASSYFMGQFYSLDTLHKIVSSIWWGGQFIFDYRHHHQKHQ